MATYQACLDPAFQCSYPDSCPCFVDPDGPPPSQEFVDEVLCAYIGLKTTLTEVMGPNDV